MTDAPGEPGTPLRWLASGKSGAGAAFGPPGRVWFTIADGILTETAFPRIDQACLRDFGLVVTDGETLFAEEKRDCDSVVRSIAPGVPGYDLVNIHRGPDPRFRIRKRVVADPVRAAVLQHIRLEPLGDSLDPGAPPLLLHALIAPHLVNDSGYGTAWIGEYKGVSMLFAEGQGAALAVAVSGGWHLASAGFVGTSDGWHDLQRHHRMLWTHERAVNGNVALIGQIAPGQPGQPQEAVLALGFGRLWTEAALRARSALDDGFAAVERGFVAPWLQWQGELLPLNRTQAPSADAAPDADTPQDLYRNSMAMLRVHGCQPFPGAVIGSLAVPWGAALSDGVHTGNHLVRPRDVCACAAARLAAGDVGGIADALGYLEAVQEPDGAWPLNFWLDGMTAWRGLGLEDVAQPILLADLALHHDALDAAQEARFWPMLRAAALFLLRQDPHDGLNRWNEEGGSAVPQLAAQAAALVAAGLWAERHGEAALGAVLAQTADLLAASVAAGIAAQSGVQADPDLLLAVRAGILPASNPHIVQAVDTLDAQLMTTLPGGAAWRRRAELAPHAALIAERALYALQYESEGQAPASGDGRDSTTLLGSLEAVAGPGGLLPEQVDEAQGCGGAVMPHLWTHALHVILLRSRRDGAVFDRARGAAARYRDGVPPLALQRWAPDRAPPPRRQPGLALRLELPGGVVLRWTDDGWSTLHRAEPVLSLPGLTMVLLPPAEAGRRISLAWGPEEGAQQTAELTVGPS